MESNKPTIKKLMDESIFKDRKFEDSHKQQVLNRISRKNGNIRWIPRSLNVVFSLILLISVLSLLSNELPGLSGSSMYQGSTPEQPQDSINTAASPSIEDSNSNEEIVEKPVEETEKNKEGGVSEGSLFELTTKEQQIYESFSEDFNTAHLKNLEPLSVAKLYVYAGYEQNFEVQYELLTDREESIMWDKTYDLNIPQEDRATPEEVIATYNNLENGEFQRIEEHTGVITFQRTEGPEGMVDFQMIQNDDGIWQVSFMPLQ